MFRFPTLISFQFFSSQILLTIVVILTFFCQILVFIFEFICLHFIFSVLFSAISSTFCFNYYLKCFCFFFVILFFSFFVIFLLPVFLFSNHSYFILLIYISSLLYKHLRIYFSTFPPLSGIPFLLLERPFPRELCVMNFCRFTNRKCKLQLIFLQKIFNYSFFQFCLILFYVLELFDDSCTKLIQFSWDQLLSIRDPE